MSDLAFKPWTTDQFFSWQSEQEERYELVEGFPLKMMTGASNRHDDIVVNIISGLKRSLKGTSCRPFTADGSIETKPGQIRRPDVGVDCGPRDPNSYTASRPVVAIEVLSPSTRNFDRFRKIEEYKQVPSLRHITFVEPDRPSVVLWSRRDDGQWSELTIEELGASIDLVAIAVILPLSDIYDGVDLRS